MSKKTSKYPEHDKIKALGGSNDVLGGFLEWLNSNGYEICNRRDIQKPGHYAASRIQDRAIQMRENYEEGSMPWLVALIGQIESNQVYWPENKPIEKWLAEYYKIDLKKLEKEKMQILDDFRALQSAKTPETSPG